MRPRSVLLTAVIIVLAFLASVFIAPKVFAATPAPSGAYWKADGRQLYPEVYVNRSDVRRWKGYSINTMVALATPLCTKLPAVPIPRVGGVLRGAGVAMCMTGIQFYGWRLQDTFARAWAQGKCVVLIVYSPIVIGTKLITCR